MTRLVTLWCRALSGVDVTNQLRRDAQTAAACVIAILLICNAIVWWNS